MNPQTNKQTTYDNSNQQIIREIAYQNLVNKIKKKFPQNGCGIINGEPSYIHRVEIKKDVGEVHIDFQIGHEVNTKTYNLSHFKKI